MDTLRMRTKPVRRKGNHKCSKTPFTSSVAHGHSVKTLDEEAHTVRGESFPVWRGMDNQDVACPELPSACVPRGSSALSGKKRAQEMGENATKKLRLVKKRDPVKTANKTHPKTREEVKKTEHLQHRRESHDTRPPNRIRSWLDLLVVRARGRHKRVRGCFSRSHVKSYDVMDVALPTHLTSN